MKYYCISQSLLSIIIVNVNVYLCVALLVHCRRQALQLCLFTYHVYAPRPAYVWSLEAQQNSFTWCAGIDRDGQAMYLQSMISISGYVNFVWIVWQRITTHAISDQYSTKRLLFLKHARRGFYCAEWGGDSAKKKNDCQQRDFRCNFSNPCAFAHVDFIIPETCSLTARTYWLFGIFNFSSYHTWTNGGWCIPGTNKS